MKKDRIYKQIKQNIISGNLRDGDKLPTEFECMDIYQVSRDTVRGAFKLLEKEGYIKRVKSKGTFICVPEVPLDHKNIYLLVSCYRHLSYASQHSLQIMFDLIAECALAGWNLVPVVFSRTNSPTDIWWENLSRFNAESRLVIPQLWYSNCFKKISGIGTRVAFISNDAELPDDLKQYTGNWSHFIEQDKAAGIKAVDFLAGKKCKKIALLMNCMDDPRNSLRQGYAEALKKYQLPYCALHNHDYLKCEEVKQFYEQEKFDGLIIHISEYRLPNNCSFRDALGLPADIPIITIPRNPSGIYNDCDENIYIVEYQIRKMCHDVVSYLISPQNHVAEKAYEPYIRRSDIQV